MTNLENTADVFDLLQFAMAVNMEVLGKENVAEQTEDMAAGITLAVLIAIEDPSLWSEMVGRMAVLMVGDVGEHTVRPLLATYSQVKEMHGKGVI